MGVHDACRTMEPILTDSALTHAHADPSATAWKHDGVRVVPADQLDPNTAQTPGMDRQAAITFARTGAQKLWAGTVHIHPNAKTGAHHHGPLESVIYVVKGRARMRWGDRSRVHRRGRPGRLHLRAAVRAAPGDQREPHRDAGVRAGAQRRAGGGGQPRHRAGRAAGGRGVGRSDASGALSKPRRWSLREELIPRRRLVIAATQGCVMRRSVEIAWNSSTSSSLRPTTRTPYCAAVSDSSTAGVMNTPRPSPPKAFISAASSNSPMTRGRILREASQQIDALAHRRGAAGQQHRCVVQALREGALERALQFGRGEEAHRGRAERVVERLHAGLAAQWLVGQHQVQALHGQLAQQVGELALVADQAHVGGRGQRRLQQPVGDRLGHGVGQADAEVERGRTRRWRLPMRASSSAPSAKIWSA